MPDPDGPGPVPSGSHAREGTATARTGHDRYALVTSAAGHGDVHDSRGDDLAFTRGR